MEEHERDGDGVEENERDGDGMEEHERDGEGEEDTSGNEGNTLVSLSVYFSTDILSYTI